jgi:23S rRNA pseudouridine2605 synthase
MILDGRVRVDGQVVTELGTQVDPRRQKIEVDGMLIPSPRRRYIVLNKPSGYITTMDDERGRWTVMDLVPTDERVVPVGRLDRQTEGLLLLTNDGELAHRVMHPRYGIEKEYEALLDGHPPAEVLERLRRGITIDGERTRPEVVRPIRNVEDGTIVRVVIHEGRNRIVRRMFEEVGYPVLKLIRTRVGPLQLGAIPRGQWRDLTDGELRGLREAVHLGDEDLERAPRPAPRSQPAGPPGGRRPMRSTPPTGRPARPLGRPSNAQRFERSERVERPQRAERTGQPPRFERSDRPARAEPADGDRGDRFQRQEPPDGQRPTRSPRRDDEQQRPGPRDADRRAERSDRDRRPARRPDRPSPAGPPRRQRPPDQVGPQREDRQQGDRPRRPAAGPPRRGPGGPGGGKPGGKPRRPGGGSGRPPVHNRNRRSGGGG